MGQLLRLSEHPLSQRWLAQFRSSADRGLAARLLNQLKLVSARDFEAGMLQALVSLQARLQESMAVYPIGPAMPDGIAGHDPFSGALPKGEASSSRAAGRQQPHGREARLGHMLANLPRSIGAAGIACAPALTQLHTQSTRHIVLVDDLCDNGQRITDYWRIMPRRIKSLLSLKRYELWLVCYAATPAGKAVLMKALPNFPLADHLLTVLPATATPGWLTEDWRELCAAYAKRAGMKSAELGHASAACPLLFEHGCPNTLPAILWASRRDWQGLFPNGSIPAGMRACFAGDGAVPALAARADQPKPVLRLLDALDRTTPLTAEQRRLLMLLDLRQGGIAEADLAASLQMDGAACEELLRRAAAMNLYEQTSAWLTPLGQEVVSRFHGRFGQARRSRALGKMPTSYYPEQCEGKLRKLGITDLNRLVPREPR